jgi:transposase
MRYELSDYEWTAIKPMLPNKPCGVQMTVACSMASFGSYVQVRAMARPARELWALDSQQGSEPFRLAEACDESTSLG